MTTINEQLPEDMICEDEGIYTIGDNLVYTFVNGNFSQGVRDMQSQGISTSDLIEYLEQQSDEFGMQLDDMYYGYFDRSFFSSLGRV